MPTPSLTNDLNRRFEYAKAFLELAKSSDDEDARQTHIEVAVTLGFSFLEGTLTYIVEHFDKSDKFNCFERSILLEQDLRLKDGEPSIMGTKFRSIEDRIQFIFWMFTARPFDRTHAWWPHITNAISYRNSIMHPKAGTAVKIADAERHLTAILETTDALFKVVFGKGWPRAKRGLYSKVSV